MKTVILALLVLVVVSQGEALRCYCGGTLVRCASHEFTCSGKNQVCARITRSTEPENIFIQTCMEEKECKKQMNKKVPCDTCCKTDLCN